MHQNYLTYQLKIEKILLKSDSLAFDMIPSFKDVITIFAAYYGFSIGIKNFTIEIKNSTVITNKYYNIYLYSQLIIEIILSILLAHYSTRIFIGMVCFNIIYDMLTMKIEIMFWKKIDEIKNFVKLLFN